MENSNYFESKSHKIAVLIKETHLIITKIRSNEVKKICISPNWLCNLHFISKFEKPPTISELSKAQNMSNSALVSINKRMERAGLLIRKKDIQNKKYTRVYLTRKGRALYKKALALNSFDLVMSKISDADKENLLMYLNEIYTAGREILHGKNNHK